MSILPRMCTWTHTVCNPCMWSHPQCVCTGTYRCGLCSGSTTCVLYSAKRRIFVCRPEFSQVNVKDDYTSKLFNINHAQLLNLDLITRKQCLKFTSAFLWSLFPCPIALYLLPTVLDCAKMHLLHHHRNSARESNPDYFLLLDNHMNKEWVLDFEMIGNWSKEAYFRTHVITWSTKFKVLK